MSRQQSTLASRITSDRLALLGVVFLLLAVLIVNLVPEANQYELSLYDALPVYFWLLLVGAMAIGAVLVLRASRRPRDGSWKYGVSLILLGDALLLLLPYIRGYQFWGRGDTLSHMGFVRDILATGGTAGNIYPATHLLVIAVQSATGVELSITTLFVPLGLSIVYLGAMYFLLTTMFEDRKRRLYGLAFGLVPVLGPSHLMLRPFDQSLALLPLVFFLFVKEQQYPSRATRTAFVVALAAFLLYHPLTAMFAIVVFVLYLLSRRAPWVDQRFVSPTNFVSLSLAVFLIWYTNFVGIIRRFNRIYGTLSGQGGGNTPLGGYTQTLDQASPAFVDLVRIGTFKYGLEGVLFGLGFALLGLSVLYLFNRTYPFNTHETMFLWTMALFSLGGLAFLVLDLIVPHERPFQIAKLASVVLAGQLFYLLRTSVDWDGLGSTAMTGFKTVTVVTLVVLITLSMFSVYNSPLESESNEQVTEMELEGTEWLTSHPGATDQFLEFDMRYYRFYHAQNGLETHPFVGGNMARDPPKNFNYTTYDTLGQSFEEDHYMIITRKGRIVYPQAYAGYEEFWRFQPSDFERLEHDTTVGRIYDNGDVELYLVDGVRA